MNYKIIDLKINGNEKIITLLYEDNSKEIKRFVNEKEIKEKDHKEVIEDVTDYFKNSLTDYNKI